LDSIVFVKSAPSIKECPTDNIPEFAFIGRSNVGKSSLINFLAQKSGLAQVSSKPGKTKLMNYFKVDDAWHLVDLPGYGYAIVAQTKRLEWEARSKVYLNKREQLVNVFLLIDCSIPPQKLDIDMINWLGERSIPFCIVATKADRIKAVEYEKWYSSYQEKLAEVWEEFPKLIKTSVDDKLGKDELYEYIGYCLKMWEQYRQDA